MSYPMCAAPAALLSTFNARAWSAVEVFERDGSGITLPTFTGRGAGVFFDAVDFLCGRGVAAAETWPSKLSTAWGASGAAGTITLEIDPETGRLAIETSTTDFAISADASLAALGFDPAGHALMGGAPEYRLVAPNPFQLGEISGLSFEIDPDGAAGAFTVFDGRLEQDIITAMRAQDAGDIDAREETLSLQYLDADVHGLTIRWGIDQHGHVYCARLTASTEALTWTSTSFRDRLGFSGREVEVASGGVSVLRAEHPLPGMIVFPDGLDEDGPGYREIGAAGERIGPTASVLVVGDQKVTRIKAYVTGPAEARDIHEHYRSRFLPYVARGERVTLYRMWGDPRRRLRAFEVTSTQPAHDLVYTTDASSYRGRQEGHRHSTDSDAVDLVWEGGVMQQAGITMLLREA